MLRKPTAARNDKFLSTLSLRRATMLGGLWVLLTLIFLSTLSLRRATHQSQGVSRQTAHFYPRSPCGERHLGAGQSCNVCHFYPRSPCGERRWLRCWQLAARDISIHALLAESDERADSFAHAPPQISIHALLAESDASTLKAKSARPTFLSTLSLRRATETAKTSNADTIFLSTLSLRRATTSSR